MRFGVLGAIAAWTDDGTSVRIPDRKVRALLADLLLHAGRPVATSVLIDDLWADELPENPTATLQTRVSQLRRALDQAEPGARALVVTQPPGYMIDVAQEAIDSGRFRMLAARARETSGPSMRAATLADALRLWRGPAYADVEEKPFVRPAVERLSDERLVVQEAYAETRLVLGEHNELAAELAELVSRNPLRQRLRAVHMRALHQSGRQADALNSYAELREGLAEELGLDPNPELASLHQAILDEDPALVPRSQPHRRTNLPAAVSSLVGRDDAMDDVLAAVENARLVTLCGPGGVGKTSLAFAAARALSDDFAGGVWLADLATLDESATAEDITRVMFSVFYDDGTATDDQRALIVLDNCEHVVAASAKAVNGLLRDRPHVRVLATSRESLAVAGEQRYVVTPLDLPLPGAALDELAEVPAIRLFVARASAADPGFGLTDANRRSVAEICHRLDGLPLAIELAAGRAQAMDVNDLAARLDDRFRLLANRQRDVPERQRTLLSVVEWSWNLLTAQEQAVLRRLSLHPGGCTLAAAEAVCADADVPLVDVTDVLGRLVERSLLVRSNTTSGSRYRLLETVRSFCLARLEDAGEVADTRQRYERYFETLAATTEPHLYGHSSLFAYLGGLYRDEAPRESRVSAHAWPDAGSVVSADGTRIAVEQFGEGPPVVFVCGALNDRRAFVPLARHLAAAFTVVIYDRRGRGGSDDTPPYAVEREVQDLAAVIDSVGGEACALGVFVGSGTGRRSGRARPADSRSRSGRTAVHSRRVAAAHAERLRGTAEGVGRRREIGRRH